MLLLFGYGRSLIDQLPDIWSIRGSSSIKTKAYLVLVDAVAKIFLLFRPTQRIMTCNDPQLQLAWYLVDAVAMLFKITNPHLSFISCTVMTHYYRYVMYICGVYLVHGYQVVPAYFVVGRKIIPVVTASALAIK